MNKIVYAWELGGGYGHIGAFLSVAKQFQQRGHEVVFVLKNLEHAHTLLGKYGFAYFQAPMRWPGNAAMPPAINYAGILRNAGFHETAGLLARTQAWKTTIACLKPDLLLFDHAPTALLAARELKIPRALFGTGFYSPPRLSPMPAMRSWLHVSERELANSEAQVLAMINSVADRLGGRYLTALADLFEVEADFLCTLPELDHYQGRKQGVYWGPAFSYSEGENLVWPSVGDKRIFAYLNKDYAGLEPLLQQLRSSSWSVFAHIPGTTPASIQKYSSANLRISAQPVDMRQAAMQCDLSICHAGAGTSAAMLLSGKPLLMLPIYLEQLLTARTIAMLGAGVCIPPEMKKPNYRAAAMEVLSNNKYTKTAGKFADKYAAFTPEEQAVRIVERCEALMR
ncbi:glycosyltransferase [Methylobacter sp. YRD-M1]|uniref:glycosyltransferase n=1 Tax=Methylobacter sp. YRD-M1 TaxID=2911520 RepID=UPI00227C4ADD|nr:nucleotide disphospho-sugar-binding domain-containing protein [Methylobacter sp. YRD-M1]WAK00369.1 hypothetical protein LZ558_10915 [Methylobacter sp. YRD-M1]